ncbi:copper resistance system multicopper oxidase [Alkanindiges illinoisensis]|uniref:Copper resistance system multicopper oxidase n=1 Tax=Alkanindiges illinoisensis TaxID=197183 RepID=A0A4Y7XGB4_9GAMM|nr:copper resistance system multicopper oxidase [Alkanindiges illinoisensis]TEU30740.1 copper resistance system multicopper oxidase [Alkanindiges illinoisensis]
MSLFYRSFSSSSFSNNLSSNFSAPSRRQFIQGIGISTLLASNISLGKSLKNPENLLSPNQPNELTGNVFDLHVGYQAVNFSGKARIATTVNHGMPGPLLRMREGDTVSIRVHNHLQQDTSIHWHGLLLPYQMDGVPGISFEGIKPGQVFTYQFKLQQSGTYWYHAHSTFQEQTGLLGAMIIEPKAGERHTANREHVLLLSDWTDLDPVYLLSKLKKHSHFDNQHKPTLIKLMQDIKQQGFGQAIQLRQMWNQMRMSPTDFADLSAGTYTFLMNGHAPAQNWTGLFKKGEKLRLRIINGSANTFFDLRIPGLKMTVIAADGQDVEPVTVDEIRLGVAETYDVLVQPVEDAYTIFAQSMDRTGFACGTLAVQAGLTSTIPALDPVEWLGMQDMGHAMTGNMAMDQISHSGHRMSDMALGHTSSMQQQPVRHASTEMNNPNVDMQVNQPRTNLDDPGVNLRQSAKTRRVLTYADLHTIGGSLDSRMPTREIELHLTGNMERYVWGLDGQTFHEAKPVHLKPKERVRFTLVNDTMMTHPMHLHGMWSELCNPEADHQTNHFQVRKHTINVQPAQKISFDVTAIEGRWAWHCHLLYHMEAGMFREVVVA